jgi:hypothetical protein
VNQPLTTRLRRLILRLWATRHTPAPSLTARVRVVWATTWRHCWDYRDLRAGIEAGRIDGTGGTMLEMLRRDWGG